MNESASDNKRKRNRKALSCTECKARKIKCDRGEPQCQSCVIRGIEGICTYGSLPQERKKGHEHSQSVEKTSRAIKKACTKRKDRHGDRDNVDLIVEAVMERLKKKKKHSHRSKKVVSTSSEDSVSSDSSSSSISLNSPISVAIADVEEHPQSQQHMLNGKAQWQKELQIEASKRPKVDIRTILNYRVKVPLNTLAKRMHISAFGGFRPPHPFFPFAVHPHTHVDPDDLIHSLKTLPNKKVVQILIDCYFKHLEPGKGAFNEIIWKEQMVEFWQDVELLYSGQRQSVQKTGKVELKTSLVKKGDPGWYAICMLPRQGLIAVIFRLMTIGCRISKTDELIKLGVISQKSFEADYVHLLDELDNAAERHFESSKGFVIPTLWTLQYQRLVDFSTVAMIANYSLILKTLNGSSVPDQFPRSNLASMQVAVSLGLNRLGSGYDDINDPTFKQSNTYASGSDGPNFASTLKESDQGFGFNESELPNKEELLTSSMKFGSSVAVFAEGNLAHRELGRKLWSNIVIIDSFISSHINQFHYISDLVDRTAPPLPIDDADLFSPNVKSLVSQCRSDNPHPNQSAYHAYSVAISKILRKMVILENKKGAPLPYSDILMLDDQFHDLFDSLPKFLSLRGSEDEDPHSIDRKYLLQRGLINDQASFRLIIVHRAYLGRGFKDQRYRRSLLSCIEAAHGILEGRRFLRKAGCVFLHAVFLESHLIHASLVFQLVLLHELERPLDTLHQTKKLDENSGYGLVDIDKMIENLEECLTYLDPGSDLQSLKDYAPALKRFLAGVKEKIRIQRKSTTKTKTSTAPIQSRVDRQKREIYDTSDAASILASMPKTPISHSVSSASPLTPSTLQTFDANSLQGKRHQSAWTPNLNDSSNSSVIDAAQSGAELTVPSLSVYDPSIWSLDALFPNYGDDGIDLIAALENELMFGGNSTAR